MATGPYYDEGRYVCEIINQALGETSTQKPQLVLRFNVLGRPDPEDPEHYISVQQYERTFYRVITDKTMPYLLEDLKALGYKHSSFRFLDPNTQGFQNFAGQQIDMWCKHEADQNGNMREKWSIARTSAFEVKPIETKKMRELDNLFGKHLKELEVPEVVPNPTNGRATANHGRPATEVAPITDEDIPF